MEVNDNDQIVFLPLKFILDNMQKSIQWAKELHQTSIFLKLDSSKAYDRINWISMFQVMEKLEECLIPLSIQLECCFKTWLSLLTLIIK